MGADPCCTDLELKQIPKLCRGNKIDINTSEITQDYRRGPCIWETPWLYCGCSTKFFCKSEKKALGVTIPLPPPPSSS